MKVPALIELVVYLREAATNKIIKICGVTNTDKCYEEKNKSEKGNRDCVKRESLILNSLASGVSVD